jgi:hypothetical protein
MRYGDAFTSDMAQARENCGPRAKRSANSGAHPVKFFKFGERGRNRTFNLLIKSHVSEFGCTDTNCSSDNNLKTEMPAWTDSQKR